MPNLAAKLQYHEIPCSPPLMSSDEKAAFIDIMLKCVIPCVGDTETGFRITFLSNDDGAEAIPKLKPIFLISFTELHPNSNQSVHQQYRR